MILMFFQFLVDKYENRLLTAVDRRMTEELVGRFKTELAPQDPLMLAVRRLVDAILPNTERLVVRQAELWQASMEAANTRWVEMSQRAGRQLETALEASLSKGLDRHAQELMTAEQKIAEQNRQHWLQLQEASQQMAAAMSQQQAELVRQGEVLLKVIEANDQIARMEQSLNRNLQSLAGAKNFEETVVSLAAAIQLLSARLGQPADGGRTIDLPRHKSMVQAA
jgi:hypothetical protein